MKPYYQNQLTTIYHTDCRELLPSLSGISAVVTDPPYELGFMGKSWDSKGVSFQPETWQIIQSACLPGAPLLSFGGSRTQHRIACAIEDAGWEIRDTLMYVYGSGFPKSLDISKAIDKQFGVKREVIGKRISAYGDTEESETNDGRNLWGKPSTSKVLLRGKPITPEAQLWEGYGTALKPAYEPIILAMNPLDGTFANNALKYKVAGLNIDGCRIEVATSERIRQEGHFRKGNVVGDSRAPISAGQFGDGAFVAGTDLTKGRFPANFLHDGSQIVMELFPETKSGLMKQHINGGKFNVWRRQYPRDVETIGDSGSAARFFYCAKASKAERNRGCEACYFLHDDVPLSDIEEIKRLLSL